MTIFLRNKETTFKVPVLSADVSGPSVTTRVVASLERGKGPGIRGRKAGTRGKGVRGVGTTRGTSTTGKF